jgi:D-arginine dehydrogenase
MNSADILIIGAGIAGVSLAAQLAVDEPAMRVLLLEREAHPGTHATGRSAANWEPTFGPPVIRALTLASGAFYRAPPAGFADAPLITPRGILLAALDGQDALLASWQSLGYQDISAVQAHRMLPALKSGAGAPSRFLLDDTCADVDVDLLMQGYVRQFRAAGGTLATNAEVQGAQHRGGTWQLATPQGVYAAPMVVNAGGAWADVIATRCRVAELGLQPKRRSAAIVLGSGMEACRDWPQFAPADDSFYAKPMGGRLMLSPADADPVEPHDAWADDYKLAEAVEGLSHYLNVEVTRLERTWGGLRTFTSDGVPVAGFDGAADGFFWLAGQGGYGIQTAPALAAAASALLRGQPLPAAVTADGVTAAGLAATRPGLARPS